MREGPALTEARARRASVEARLALAEDKLAAIEALARDPLPLTDDQWRAVLRSVLGVPARRRSQQEER